MPNYRVDYDHGEKSWVISKDGNRVEFRDKKSAAVSRARELARNAADREGYAHLQIHGEGGQVTDTYNYGEDNSHGGNGPVWM